MLILEFPGVSAVKNPPASAGDAGSIPGSGGSPGGGQGNPLQFSCLGNPWTEEWAIVHGIAKTQTQFSNYTTATAMLVLTH